MIIDRKQANLFNLFNLFRLIRILSRLTRALLRLTAYHSPIRVTLLHFTTLKISEKKNKCNRDKTLIAVLKSLSLQSRPPQKRLKSQSAVNSWKLRYVIIVNVASVFLEETASLWQQHVCWLSWLTLIEAFWVLQFWCDCTSVAFPSPTGKT